MKENTTIDKKYNTLIVLVSIVIPVVVAILFNVKLKDLGYDVEPLSFLPPIYATINGITAVVDFLLSNPIIINLSNIYLLCIDRETSFFVLLKQRGL